MANMKAMRTRKLPKAVMTSMEMRSPRKKDCA